MALCKKPPSNVLVKTADSLQQFGISDFSRNAEEERKGNVIPGISADDISKLSFPFYTTIVFHGLINVYSMFGLFSESCPKPFSCDSYSTVFIFSPLKPTLISRYLCIFGLILLSTPYRSYHGQQPVPKCFVMALNCKTIPKDKQEFWHLFFAMYFFCYMLMVSYIHQS